MYMQSNVLIGLHLELTGAWCVQVAAYLEERVNVGVNFILSAELDHWKKDYKFGFGMTVGE